MPILAAITISFAWPYFLGVLASILLLSGIDDLLPVLICAAHRLFGKRAALPAGKAKSGPERRIAIFVPCWRESNVIESMVRHNIARIRYRNFDFFLGVYPNDQATSDVALDLASSLPNVHVAVCPKAGPTSKADCLNAIYRGMTHFESGSGVRFDTIVLHDAEDLIHSDALGVIDREREHNEMVQVPVLPIPTGPADLTHGIYCDEFAEFQMIDMRARQCSRAFIPSNGVGTGFSRDVLERLAAKREGSIFDPSSLTEDYEIGVQFHEAGCRQIFSPLVRAESGIIATREYFPRTMQSAIRQRARWLTGIALQTWERHGWRGTWRTRYWFWRDRKGILTNPVSLLTNVLFVAGLADFAVSRTLHRPWGFAATNAWVVQLSLLTAGVQVFRLALRSACVARLFGIGMGLTVWTRCFYANFVNCVATFTAIRNYTLSRFHRKQLTWDKTQHAFPAQPVAVHQQMSLEKILSACGFLSEAKLEMVRNSVASSNEIPDFLLRNRLVSEEQLCRAMSIQSGLPWSDVDVRRLRPNVARSIPKRIATELDIVPFRVSSGKLHVAAKRVPQAGAFEIVSRFTRLTVQFQLVTGENYAQLREVLRFNEPAD